MQTHNRLSECIEFDVPIAGGGGMNAVKTDEIRQTVREKYGRIAGGNGVGCCSGGGSGCCGSQLSDPGMLSKGLGYSDDDVGAAPQGANLGLGCGNPTAIAALRPGEFVLDLGSGGGFDCFLAARQIGETGHVIGVDMTPEMISRARANAEQGGYRNVEFRLGEIENLPVADGIIDVILSNCVINLSPDKPRVFAEMFRVLKPGGRLAISDVVACGEMPEEIRRDMALYTGCIAGASPISDIERMLADRGFVDIRVCPKDESQSFMRDWAPGTTITDYVISATIEATKPANASVF
jgi:SAM-dependent methyltransferase